MLSKEKPGNRHHYFLESWLKIWAFCHQTRNATAMPMQNLMPVPRLWRKSFDLISINRVCNLFHQKYLDKCITVYGPLITCPRVDKTGSKTGLISQHILMRLFCLQLPLARCCTWMESHRDSLWVQSQIVSCKNHSLAILAWENQEWILKLNDTVLCWWDRISHPPLAFA